MPSALLAGYQAESLERILSVLEHGSRSAVLRDDPNGTSALMQVGVRRREARRLRRRGVDVQRRVLEASLGFDPSPRGPSPRNVTLVEVP